MAKVAKKEPKGKIYDVDDFLRLAVNFYKTMGIDPYETGRKSNIWFQLYYVANVINMTYSFFADAAYAANTLRDSENLLESCMVLSYVTFGAIGLSKICALMYRRPKMTSLVKQLKSCFPSSALDQEEYDVKSCLKRTHMYTKGFGVLYTVMYFAHTLIPIFIYFCEKVLLKYPNAKQTMPFYQLELWEWRDTWWFYPTYVHQSHAGYTATCGSIASDLMIFAVVLQVIMHYDRLAKVLRELKVEALNKPNGADEDLRKLQSLIANHIDILRLTDVMNEVFGVSLLLNFVASSLLVCLVGFQLTIKFSLQYFCKQVLLLVSLLFEVYLLCSFSQKLIDASENVGYAAYEMDWLGADKRFKKMLIYISMRAQKPVCLKATIFLNLSMSTVTIFLRVTYKFFCAIRTMY
ncbi:odorant receptor 67a-like [Drosophila teissieri]|uniref:odorant receptor 67a-like n=1 Tax=Drosophila teissieri TaxID=7243 RepID=UPI001CBA3447|nr:odorant receptor 67a-like [Drosophila teissieri]